MAYEYEGENIRKVRLYNIMTGSSKKTKPIKELEEVYAKAKVFDEIVEVFKDYPLKTDSDVMDFIQAKLDDMEDK